MLDIGAGNAPGYMVTVQNDSTSGISSSEVNRGGDKVQFTDPITGDSKSRRIIKILEQDPATMVLGVSNA